MSKFNIRVYGIMQDEKKRVLVSDELIRGAYITKFPGGGLEFGEGTRDCLKREFMEELGLEVQVEEHLYTTDFFQMSAFNPEHQIISIYYRVKPLAPFAFAIREKPFDFDEALMERYQQTREIETARFIDWPLFSDEDLTLPIDKVVARMVKASW